MTLGRLGDGWHPLLRQALVALGAEPLGSSENVGAMGELLDQVVTWNAHINLTSARSPEELVDLYVADAAVVALHSPDETATCVDVGAGGGAPGLPLAILVPGLSFTLVEPRAKRVAFLRTVAFGLVGNRARVVRDRSQDLPPGGWEMAVSRAALAPPEWLLEGTRLARRAVWVLLGQGAVPSCSGWRVTADVSYELPFTGAGRRALCFTPK